MPGKPKKNTREKDITARFLSGGFDEDALSQRHRFGQRSKDFQQRKMERTALLRAAEETSSTEVDALPLGQVIQVHSLFSEVILQDVIHLCVVRKTLAKLADSAVVVGDYVRIRTTGIFDEQGRPEAVIEQVLPRQTVLTRADSFKAIEAQPIVANAQQMLIVASLAEPRPKWGLIDRMIIAAQSGNLSPVVCLNKLDLADTNDGRKQMDFALEALAHYQSLGITTLRTSVTLNQDLDSLRSTLLNKTTVLAGHSGVGKSSLIQSIEPELDIRVAEISHYTGKGRHTTTSARRYVLQMGGHVIDTPGVKLFGLWNLTRQSLSDYFPDLEKDSAPQWRRESYERILESLSG